MLVFTLVNLDDLLERRDALCVARRVEARKHILVTSKGAGETSFDALRMIRAFPGGVESGGFPSAFA